MVFLVSYNHSGNTWVRYCVEFVTRRPTHGHREFSISERDDNFLGIFLDKEIALMKRHTLEDITDKDRFILLLRDPSECIKSDQDINKEFLKYYSLIRGYDVHKGPKMIVYFNDLFKRQTIKNIIKYTGAWIHSDRIKDLEENWEYHQVQSLNLYKNETNKEGADLSEIPEILLNHELIKNTSCTIHK